MRFEPTSHAAVLKTGHGAVFVRPSGMDSSSLLATDSLLRAFAAEREKAVAAYIRFVAEGINAPNPWLALKNHLSLSIKPLCSHARNTLRFIGMFSSIHSNTIPAASGRHMQSASDTPVRSHLWALWGWFAVGDQITRPSCILGVI
jgi:hypothetical protein